MPKYKEFFSPILKRHSISKSEKIKVSRKKRKRKKNKYQGKVKLKKKPKQWTVFRKVSEIRLKHVFGPGNILRKVPFTNFR